MAHEQPTYTLVRREGDFELRRYTPRVVAEMIVEGRFEDSGNEAFRRLAGYIGGKNRSKTSISLTAPVTQEAPCMPGFQRRNEIWIEVAEPVAGPGTP